MGYSIKKSYTPMDDNKRCTGEEYVPGGGGGGGGGGNACPRGVEIWWFHTLSLGGNYCYPYGYG